MEKLLQELSIALDDWLHTYASEFCDEKDVSKSIKHIRDNGGTLSYIAELQQKIRNKLGNKNDNNILKIENGKLVPIKERYNRKINLIIDNKEFKNEN